VKFKDKYQSLLEGVNGFSSIKQTKRLFYPRNFELSPEFIKAFQKEFTRLKGLGGTTNDILRKVNKALLWLAR
jgi:hypothetical protein